MRGVIGRLTYWLVCLAMAALIAAIFLQVFFRYVLNDPLTWPEELGRYLFVWIVFLGIPEAYRDGKHLGMDLLAARLPLGLRPMMARVTETIVLVFAVVAAWTSIDLINLTLDQKAAVFQIPMALVYVAFTIGLVMIAVHTLWSWISPGRTLRPGDYLYGLGAPDAAERHAHDAAS